MTNVVSFESVVTWSPTLGAGMYGHFSYLAIGP